MAITLTTEEINNRIEDFLSGIEPLIDGIIPVEDYGKDSPDGQALIVQAIKESDIEHDNIVEAQGFFPEQPGQVLLGLERLAESDMGEFLFDHINTTADMWESDIRCVTRSLLYAYLLRSVGARAIEIPRQA